MSFDLESICDEIKAILVANLNTKITAINAEKNDDFAMTAINDDAYVFQDLNGVTQNYNPNIFYGVTDVQGEGQFGGTPSKAQFIVAVVFSDEGSVLTPARQLFRYQRALREVFEQNFQLPESGCKLSVASQVPVEITLVNSSYRHRAAAVLLTTDFG